MSFTMPQLLKLKPHAPKTIKPCSPSFTRASVIQPLKPIPPQLLLRPISNTSSQVITKTPFYPPLSPHLTRPFLSTYPSESDSDFEDDDDLCLKNPFVEEGSEYASMMAENENALYVRVDMPGVLKEGLKLYMDNNVLYIRGQELKAIGEGSDSDEPPRKYSTEVVLDDISLFKMDRVEAVMNAGVRSVTIPKLKLEEKMGVLSIPVN